MATSDRTRWCIAIGVAAITLAVPSGPSWASGFATATEPAPATTPTTPDTSVPSTSDPEVEEPDTTQPGEVSAGDDADALTWIAVVGALGLLAIAIWWMVRSTGGSPTARPMDDDWLNRSDVV